MFEIEVYFDDSGTDGGSPIAVAACYVANKYQWDEFVRNWDEVLEQEGFDAFHMSEFVAKPEAGHKPFCDWDNRKKERVYGRLASIINCRVRKGFSIAIPKKDFDEYAIKEFREQYAGHHYTFAVKSVMGLLEKWREKFRVTVPRNPDDPKYLHPGFRQLRQDRPMDVGFFSRDQLRKLFERTASFHQQNGQWPWEKPSVYPRIVLSSIGGFEPLSQDGRENI